MRDLIGVRCYFVSRSRYAYRGRVRAIEEGHRSTRAILTEITQVIDLGTGIGPPKEEIPFPDGGRIDLDECEWFGPEPASWTQ